MGVPYEYNLVVRVFPISRQGNVATPEGQKVLTQPMAKFIREKLPEAIISSGWAVNSHSITFYNNQAVLSVLLQRG
jgi:hypothetical protein